MTMQGYELKALRKEMNLRQASLAEALGLTPQFIGMMERGEKPIEPRTALSVLYLVDHPEARPEVAIEDVSFRRPDEMFKSVFQHPVLIDGRTWGRWRFSAESLSLDLDSREITDEDGKATSERSESYYVKLCDLTDAKKLLDWIGQITSKGWGPVVVGQFVAAINDIFHIQGKFVHGLGFGSSAELKAILLKRVERDKIRNREKGSVLITNGKAL